MFLRLGNLARACRAAVLAGAVYAILSGLVQAQTIGIDWYGGSAAGADPTNQTPMLPADVAGVVPQANWNSFLGEPASSSGALLLSDGSASGATATWTSNNDWDTNIDQTLSPNHKMMMGYLDTNDTSITTIAVTGLPASITSSGYNVIVYYDGENGTQHRVGRYEINGASQWGRDAGTAFAGTFAQGQTTVDPAPGLSGTQLDNQPASVLDAVPAGNYMVFSGLTGADFTLNVQASVSAGGTNRASVNGMQIVPVPEPSSVVLLGLGAIGCIGWVARRRGRGQAA